MKKKFFAILMITMLMVSVAIPSSYAASSSTKKMTAYNDVVKSGNYAYCATSKALYKINVKTSKKTKLQNTNCDRLYKMRYHKGYLYYVKLTFNDNYKYYYWTETLYRVNVKTKKVTKLFTANDCLGEINYVISGKKIYLQYPKVINESEDTKTIRKVMNLNGKSKKTSKVKVKNASKSSNSKGYSLKTDYSEYSDDDMEGYVTYYLKTPSKKIKIARVYEVDW